MKKMLRICLLTVFCMIFVTLGGFLALTWYYGRTFVVNTWINGIYCTGMTVEEVNSELVRNMEMPELTIIDGEGQSWPLDLSLADYRVDYTDSLRTYLRRRQSSWLSQEEMTEQHLFPQAIWSHEKLRELVADMDWVREERSEARRWKSAQDRKGNFPISFMTGKAVGWIRKNSVNMYSSVWNAEFTRCRSVRGIAMKTWRIQRRICCKERVTGSCSPFCRAI